MDIWARKKLTLHIERLGATIPQDKEGLEAMLVSRMPANMPEDGTPIAGLIEEVSEEVEVIESEPGEPIHHVFKHDEKGIYIEGRWIRSHLKDCALQVNKLITEKNFRSKFVNKVYVLEHKFYTGRMEHDGEELFFIQVMTRQGPRSSLKYVSYLDDVDLQFTLLVLRDEIITDEHLDAILQYSAVHGMAGQRSLGWGRYTWELENIEPQPEKKEKKRHAVKEPSTP